MQENTALNDNKRDPIQHAEDLYFALSGNVTIEAKNIIYHSIAAAKQYYYKSDFKPEWEQLLVHLEDMTNDFENQLSQSGELKLIALQKNIEELKKKENK